MQQRVALVRAFALGAPILLMDEPFAALDEITRAEMRYLLLGLWERHEATVLFVTHSIAEAVMLSDRVVVLTAPPGARGRRRDGRPSPGPATPGRRTRWRSSSTSPGSARPSGSRVSAE